MSLIINNPVFDSYVINSLFSKALYSVLDPLMEIIITLIQIASVLFHQVFWRTTFNNQQVSQVPSIIPYLT